MRSTLGTEGQRSGSMAEGIVYVGETWIQAQHRVNVARCCKENDIHIGDRVRVWLEIIKEE